MPESTSHLSITNAQSCTTCTTLCRSVGKGRLTSHDYRISNKPSPWTTTTMPREPLVPRNPKKRKRYTQLQLASLLCELRGRDSLNAHSNVHGRIQSLARLVTSSKLENQGYVILPLSADCLMDCLARCCGSVD